jgi:phosphoenolpyruvate synthase/pyruvate phosphate dikinase
LKGSPGTARGRARVIRSLADAHRLGAGEVLVTETTAPPWTPLFARAAAIVTDAGGILSHCAVVAREYGVPAVVGTRTGTRAIEDGRLVEVDGTAGTVRMLDE